MNLPETKVIVSKKKWGQGILYQSQIQKFCALGFFLNQACKVPKEKLSGRYSPDDVLTGVSPYLKKFKQRLFREKTSASIWRSRNIEYRIMTINDGLKTVEDKIKHLTIIFKKHLNCELVFKD